MKSQRSSLILSQQEKKKKVPKDHRVKKAQQEKKNQQVKKKKVKKDHLVKKAHNAKLLKKLPQLYQSFQEKKDSALSVDNNPVFKMKPKKKKTNFAVDRRKDMWKKKKDSSSIKGLNRSSSLLFSCWLVISARVEKKDSLMKERMQKDWLAERKKAFRKKEYRKIPERTMAWWKKEGFFFERNNRSRSV
jgi:hypothetical protein